MTKNPWAMSEAEAAVAKLQEFSEEARGFMRVYLVRHDNRSVREAIERGEPLAISIGLTINKALTMGPIKRRTCISCDHVFGSDEPDAFLIWMPDCNDDKRPENVIAQAACRECCRTKDDDELLHDAMIYIRKIWPDTEEVDE